MTTTQRQVIQEQVRTLYYSNGRNLSEAARTANIPIDRAEKWKERGNWDNVITKPEMSELSESLRRTSDNAAVALANDERETRASLSRYAKNASREAENMPGVLAIAASDKVHNVAKTAAIVHRWDSKNENTQNVVVNVALLGVQPAEVSATVLDVDSEGQDSGT